MTKSEFDLLMYLKKNCIDRNVQRKISKDLKFSIGKTNQLLKKLVDSKLIKLDIDKVYKLTSKAYAQLKPYKVDNAIIMAAGMSTRFAPLSYEVPKGLLIVKGETLIEREIVQLKEKGINNIIIVVGYLKEKFYYLETKYGVKIVVNPDYYKYNNTSTLMCVKNQLKNTYICSSDNYFTSNPFEEYVYRGYYSANYINANSQEYFIKFDNKGKINGVSIGGDHGWYMIGHAYFDKMFSAKFKNILTKEYKNDETKYKLWENVYKDHVKELTLYIRKYGKGIIYEFDSLSELQKFDAHFIDNVDSKILLNICKDFKCDMKDITNIRVIKSGLTNNSFIFQLRGKKYVYRHPGIGTEKYINRKSEAYSMKVASKNNLDNTFVFMDGKEGYKISHYISGARELNYHSRKEVEAAVTLIKKLHSLNIRSKYDFNIWKKTQQFIKILNMSNVKINGKILYSKISDIYNYVNKDSVAKKCLCHNDCYSPNFIIDKQKRMSLIDWEYSGNDDPASDIGTFISCSNYSDREALKIIDMYFNNKTTKKQQIHYIGYIAICSFYWYIWSLYQEYRGNEVGEWSYLWYKNAIQYVKIFNDTLKG
ncbi:MAG: phosphotransferase [Lachnospiraceae bacterium]|nr:phosphotransferase [Lachnospiraceae bacterium]